MQHWLTVAEAGHVLDMAERTLRRHIQEGKIESKLDNGRRMVLVEVAEADMPGDMPALVRQLQQENESLRQQLEEKDKQIEKLQEQLERANEALAEASHRHDTVVMQMTRLLEYEQLPFWRKLFSRKALPPPEQIVDVEPGDNEATE